MRRVGCPVGAIVATRLDATFDLPSPSLGLVTTITRGGSSTFMYLRLVRKRRIASLAAGSTAAPCAAVSSGVRPFERSSARVAGRLDSTVNPSNRTSSGLGSPVELGPPRRRPDR